MEGSSERSLRANPAGRDSEDQGEQYFFYPWIEEENIVRWMCSFDTTEDDIQNFAKVVAQAVKS